MIIYICVYKLQKEGSYKEKTKKYLSQKKKGSKEVIVYFIGAHGSIKE